MLTALEHQKAMQTQQQELLEKEIVRQREECEPDLREFLGVLGGTT